MPNEVSPSEEPPAFKLIWWVDSSSLWSLDELEQSILPLNQSFRNTKS